MSQAMQTIVATTGVGQEGAFTEDVSKDVRGGVDSGSCEIMRTEHDGIVYTSYASNKMKYVRVAPLR